MKNIILGFTGCMLAICMVISCLSIYSISVRKNELENCTSQVVEQNLKTYYRSGKESGEVVEALRQEFMLRLGSASQLSIDVKACDMEKGILSVRVSETFTLPGGQKKEVACAKTMIVE
ncbi:MAG: hypothetical protein MR508_00400 [Lachnospiraceae bacterium]|nr:hypothetical protein [Lachnospiraceae bacterium]